MTLTLPATTARGAESGALPSAGSAPIAHLGETAKRVKLKIEPLHHRAIGNSRIFAVESIEMRDGASAVTWIDSTVRDDGLDPTSIRPAEAVENLGKAAGDSNAGP
jgi:hypothetical protein